MTKSISLNVTQTIKCPNRQITSADTTTALQMQIGGSSYTMSADQGIVKALMMTSTDTSPANVQVIINDGTNDRVIGTVAIPALAGTTGAVAAVDALSALGTGMPGLVIDQNGKYVLPLGASYIIKVKATVTLTSGKVVDAFAVVEEY